MSHPPSKHNYHQANGSSTRRSATRNPQDQGNTSPSPTQRTEHEDVHSNGAMNSHFAAIASLMGPTPIRPLQECTPQERMDQLRALTEAALAIVDLPLLDDTDITD
ncbi:unnamed protein product [Cylindrotheca closterium]|uniref:Uncharacterized protein n=1 Tax=Cylindrotheca closterium TaxID=2856 RepID=A0AAD2CHD8_9STRA|nr:unnamed protein product [Cylindrotheca closterium]